MKNKKNSLEVAAKGEVGWGGMDWDLGVNRGQLLYRIWINTRVLLYSRGYYIQYPGMSQNGKEYIRITESLGCTAEIHTAL